MTGNGNEIMGMGGNGMPKVILLRILNRSFAMDGE